MAMKRPRIEWAFFCGTAERDAGQFINATKIVHSLHAVAEVGVNFDFVFGLDGEPGAQPRCDSEWSGRQAIIENWVR